MTVPRKLVFVRCPKCNALNDEHRRRDGESVYHTLPAYRCGYCFTRFTELGAIEDPSASRAHLEQVPGEANRFKLHLKH